jgi:hypothetical protein
VVTQTVNKRTRLVRFCLVAIDRWCPFCNQPLHWSKRSDARYCSPKCRQAAHRASRLTAEVVEKTQINSPPLDYYPITMDVWKITWSSATPCDLCKRFITTGFGMAYFRGALAVFACGWKCLQILAERDEFRTHL